MEPLCRVSRGKNGGKGYREDISPTATLLEHVLLAQGFMGVSKVASPRRLQLQNRDSPGANLSNAIKCRCRVTRPRSWRRPLGRADGPRPAVPRPHARSNPYWPATTIDPRSLARLTRQSRARAPARPGPVTGLSAAGHAGRQGAPLVPLCSSPHGPLITNRY